MEIFDYLGQPLNLYYKSHNTLRTSFGGIMTIISFIIMSLMILAFGQDFFYRKNPIVVASTETLDQYEIHNLTNKNFPMAFRLEDAYGNFYNDDRNLYLIGKYFMYNKINGIWNKTIDSYIFPRPCSSKDFNSESKFHKDYKIIEYYCIDLNHKFGGYWNGDFVGHITVVAAKCLEGTYNIKKESCYNDNERPEKVENIYLNSHFPISNVNPNDYDSGIKTEIYTDYFRLDSKLKKVKYNFFEITELESDYGWMLKIRETKKVLGFKQGYLDILLVNELENLIGGFFLYSSKSIIKIKREYPKLQDLAAQVGGIMKFFITLFSIIVKNVNLAQIKLGFSDYLLKVEKDNTNLINIKQSIRNSKVEIITKSIIKSPEKYRAVDQLSDSKSINIINEDETNIVEKEIGVKVFELLKNLNTKLEGMSLNKEKKHLVIGNSSFWESLKMIFYLRCFRCCIEKNKFEIYKNISKEFNSRIELESLFKSQDQTYMFTHLFLTDEQINLLT